MQYIASLSYGKDSIIIPEICKEHGLPLDRIVHVEIMATDTIPADLPPMMEFKKKADKIIKERYGIEVEHLHTPKSYEEQFYTKYIKGKHIGNFYGFPCVKGAWCNSKLKMVPLSKLNKPNIIQYIGIAADEPNRFHNLTDRKISPLVEYGVTEAMARERAEKLGLLSPIYTQSARGGCWFCHNQSIGQLRLLRKQYPEYWALMLKWDNDSPVIFKPNGMTVHDFDERFRNEDAQLSFFEEMDK
ncbi:MAG: reductase [Clostridia bacterium]|jgi:3'-phosphoadenosine 5'-phosphosulfate sulfotransferase (PAPS reductase)/FAD synthetase|nr:reductase [Clostridia bacterium]